MSAYADDSAYAWEREEWRHVRDTTPYIYDGPTESDVAEPAGVERELRLARAKDAERERARKERGL